MAYMLEGLRKLFTGEEAMSRQLSLFSICGITGLIYGYLALEEYSPLTLFQKIIMLFLLMIFNLFFTGYEIKFMHEKQNIEIGLDIIKLALKKVPFLVFLIGIPLLVADEFFEYSGYIFLIDTVLAVPLTMLQAGVSLNYRNEDATELFKKFKAIEYIKLFFKRIWAILLGYSTVMATAILSIIIFAMYVLLWFRGDIQAINLLITGKQIIIIKFAVYFVSILIVYILSICSLIWDYELIKTEEEC